jgi:hypothetical protein
LAVDPQEGSPHAVLVAEADLARNDLDRLRSVLNARKRRLRTQPFDGPGRRISGLPQKQPGKLSRADPGRLGHPLDGKRFVQVLSRKVQCIGRGRTMARVRAMSRTAIVRPIGGEQVNVSGDAGDLEAVLLVDARMVLPKALTAR